jgi:hypothetical protein
MNSLSESIIFMILINKIDRKKLKIDLKIILIIKLIQMRDI